MRFPELETTYRDLELDLRESPVIRRLFQLRGLPAWAATVEGLQRLGFIFLATEENLEGHQGAC